MRLTTYSAVRLNEDGEEDPNIYMKAPLYIHGTYDDPMNAVPRKYLDELLMNIDASIIHGGTFMLDFIPPFVGDAYTDTASGLIKLTSVNTSTDIGYSPMVNEYGQILGVSPSVSTNTDKLVIDYSKFQINRPTTIDGYGITNAVSLKKDNIVTAPIYLTLDPIADNEAVTRSYVTRFLDWRAINKYEVGDVITMGHEERPIGFVRCNGAWVKKTEYPRLFNVIGDRFAFGASPPAPGTTNLAPQIPPLTNNISPPGSGKPWLQQYQINAQAGANLTGWSHVGSFYTAVWGSSCFITRNIVFMVGGYKYNGLGNLNNKTTSNVYAARINPDGTLGSWRLTGPLPGDGVARAQTVVTNNRVYLIGGVTNGNSVNTVFTAPINGDGSIGNWGASTPLPVPLSDFNAVVNKSKIYVIGGCISKDVNNNHITDISLTTDKTYLATLDENGIITNWASAATLPYKVAASTCAVIGNTVYLFGGWGVGEPIRRTCSGTINPDGSISNWVIGSELPKQMHSGEAIVCRKKIYLVGMRDELGRTLSDYYCDVDEHDALGAWTEGLAFPTNIKSITTFVTKDRVFALCGFDKATDYASVYSTTFKGGFTDYADTYGGRLIASGPQASELFRLPDYTAADEASLHNTCSFIKI